MSAPTERRIDALDVPTTDLEARLRAGRLAEYGHLLHDADPDSTVPVFPDLAKGRRLLDPDFEASVALNLTPPVVWDDTPDCEPVFTDRPVTNMQTGGAL